MRTRLSHGKLTSSHSPRISGEEKRALDLPPGTVTATVTNERMKKA
ncbi:hypothetical protein [Bradyrhizobium guangdongense]|nr:hypothetical protein [Bradyrhizobium guangdongense]